MRHRKKGKQLTRTASHRKALLRNLANQLFEHKEIKTTTIKAKTARPVVERLITYAKKGDLHHRRLAFNFLRYKPTIKVLFDEIAPVYSERQGGYTRILKLGYRQGDGASISLLQLVGFEKAVEAAKAAKEEKRKAKKKAADEKAKAMEKRGEAQQLVEPGEEEKPKKEKKAKVKETKVTKEVKEVKAKAKEEPAAEKKKVKKDKKEKGGK
jgi:large subunit ribosomal protein L17